MDLDKVLEWIVGIVLIFAVTGQLGVLQRWIWKEQAKLVYDSRPACHQLSNIRENSLQFWIHLVRAESATTFLEGNRMAYHLQFTLRTISTK